MAVKARWATVTVAIDESDPFAEPEQEPVRVEEVGTPIEISAEGTTLNRRLVDTLNREGILYNEGVVCEIKNNSDTSCFCCPLYEGDHNTPAGALCRLGREQQEIVTLLAVERRNGRGG